MPNPLDDLGAAIAGGDLAAASAAYKALTGRTVNPPKKAGGGKRTPKGEPTGQPVILVPAPASPTATPNRFVPDASEMDSVSKFDTKVLAKVKKTPRDRPPAEAGTVEAQCDKCPNKFAADRREVSRRLGDETMKLLCPRCILSMCKGS